MFKEYFILLLLAHIVGDFYLQTSKVAKKKAENIRWVLIHCLSYWIIIMVVLIPIMSWNVAVLGTVVGVTHAIIDVIKYLYVFNMKNKKKMTPAKERNIFFGDQILHLICLIVITYWFVLQKNDLSFSRNIAQFFDTVGIPEFTLVSWGVALLIIHKPSNIAISKLLMLYKPENKAEDKKDNNTGRFIGTVERMIMLILISIGQYSAIGLVLTAKSIARYDRISKDRDFAEYYLLGTLISTVIVIIVALLINN